MAVASVTIAAGQSLSTTLDLTTTQLTQLMSPSAWSPANVSLQLSADGVKFLDLYDVNGNEVIRAMGAARAVAIDPVLTSAATYLRLRSGPAARPVPQAADRVFTCVLA